MILRDCLQPTGCRDGNSRPKEEKQGAKGHTASHYSIRNGSNSSGSSGHSPVLSFCDPG